MEQKTILEELLERSPEEKRYNSKLDEAFKLSAKGRYAEADAIFDELLSEHPDDREIISGKKLNERRMNLSNRIESLGNREREQRSEARKSVGETGANWLRSKRVLTAIVIAFVLVCAATAAAVGIGRYEADIDELGTQITERSDADGTIDEK